MLGTSRRVHMFYKYSCTWPSLALYLFIQRARLFALWTASKISPIPTLHINLFQEYIPVLYLAMSAFNRGFRCGLEWEPLAGRVPFTLGMQPTSNHKPHQVEKKIISLYTPTFLYSFKTCAHIVSCRSMSFKKTNCISMSATCELSANPS